MKFGKRAKRTRKIEARSSVRVAKLLLPLYDGSMKLYLATNNAHKKREASEIFSPHEIVIPADEGIDFDPEETGATFFENALIKARALYDIVHCPVIADDSGISVDALGGRPGIFSSRYGGPSFPRGRADGKKTDQNAQNRFLIEELDDALSGNTGEYRFLHGERSAHYTCSMVLYLGGERMYAAQETMEGQIVSSIEDARGNGGFGYDPIFFIPEIGKTAAELSDEEKNAISHRGKAGRSMRRIIEMLR